MKVFGRFTVIAGATSYDVKATETQGAGRFTNDQGDPVDSFSDGFKFSTIMLQADKLIRYSANIDAIPRWTLQANTPYLSTAQDDWRNLFIDNPGAVDAIVELQMEVQHF